MSHATTAQNYERIVVGIEQQLVRLQRIDTQVERLAATEIEAG
ncbi:hypothetical protein [Acidovorax sp.]